MGSLCFSSASILRCESFTSLESQVLIIPTALELIFSTTLVITNWGTGWRHLLLTAEGWSYFALALLELLSHNIPAVRDSVSVFSIVDIVLGATSFLPIFFYTLFVYLFTRGELIDTLPKRFQRIANVLLLFFIPAIVALNELSSFIGISRRTLISNGRPVVAIGFQTFSDQQLWTFLTSLTLALLTAFEAINFCFAFYRLIRAFVDQRRIETTSSDSAHLIRGIGWISGGFKLGAIETVIGFAQGGFGGALTRRIIRFLARAFLIIGIVKGVDQVDDFAEVAKEMSGGRANTFRRSRLGMLISNPRFSTFRQLSPTAKDFYNAPRAGEKSNEAPAEAPPQMSEFAQLRRGVMQTQPASPVYTLAGPVMQQQQRRQIAPPQPSTLQRSLTQQTTNTTASGQRQRVTVQFSENTAPTLHMRFSGLEMPSPAVIAENVKSRPLSASWVSIARESRYAPSIAPSFAFDPIPPMTAPPVPVPTITYPEFIYERQPEPESTLGDAQSTWSYRDTGKGKAVDQREKVHARGMSEFSVRSSGYPDSLSAVRELADQFPVPGIPPTQRPAPTPIPEQWEDAPAPRQRQWDAERGYGRQQQQRDSAYGGTDASSAYPQQDRYTYGGVEYPEPEADEEPVYRYAYDGPVSPERIPHPIPYSPPRMNDAYSPPSDNVYANPYSPPQQRAANQTRHRNIKSDTTMGTTPQTNLSSRFDVQSSLETSTPNTEAESDPFQFDVALDTGMSGKARQQQEEYAFPQEGQGVPEEVFMDDGPHSYRGQHTHNASVATRTSAALLQMTQRGNADWAPAGVEFTPSVFSEPTTAPSSRHNTLRKKRRPSMKSDRDVPESVDTLASSWLHGDMLHDEMMDADDELPQMPVGGGGSNASFGRVKSVGRVRAPKKATPAPVTAKHGLMRGSVSIQPIMVPPAVYSSEVQIVQGGSSADSYNSEFPVSGRP
ncbi:hypothetical protein MVEN_01803700 [Mycena venus]|uniref:Uncharacterized protein n=1 Tax=Mycena venus TaxID=2733690 RepID=A0A8H7CLJ1_9AGAR|nr:hypothetical protein MVEN_01803700 [Mycena venus]